MKEISSRQNHHFKRWISLLESKGIKKHHQFLLSGEKFAQELLKTHPHLFQEIIVTKEFSPPFGKDLNVFQLPKALFQTLDIFGTHQPLYVGSWKTFSIQENFSSPKNLEVLSTLGDPSNLGALLRSCEAFGIKKIILLKESAHPFHPKALRASAGSAFRLEYTQGPSLKTLSQEISAPIISLDAQGEDLHQWTWPKDAFLLMGEEGLGLPKDLPFQRIKIPTTKHVESLNVTVATSLALYSYTNSKK